MFHSSQYCQCKLFWWQLLKRLNLEHISLPYYYRYDVKENRGALTVRVTPINIWSCSSGNIKFENVLSAEVDSEYY